MSEMMTTRNLKKLNTPGLEINPEVFQKLVATDGAIDDLFGVSVAVSGDGSTVVVGATGDNDKGDNSGSAYVFTRQSNGTYLLTQKLVASDGAAFDLFGCSVAISGDGSTVVIGAHFDDDGDKEVYSGSAYVFTKQANGGYLETQKLVATDEVHYEYFGYSVAVTGDGSTVVVGAYGNGDRGFNAGAAYIFTKQTNGSYLQTQKLVADDGADFDSFGVSVATSADGSTVVVGAHLVDDKGSTYIFTKQANGSYEQTQKLIAYDGRVGDLFGRSVAVTTDGSVVIVGAFWDGDKGYNSGAVYIFTKEANGSYLHAMKLIADDGAAGDSFGRSVTVSADGSIIVVGAYGDDDKGIQSGSVYIFTKEANGSYLQTKKLVADDEATYDYFGYCVAISNTSVVVGAYNHLDKGAVYVY